MEIGERGGEGPTVALCLGSFLLQSVKESSASAFSDRALLCLP